MGSCQLCNGLDINQPLPPTPHSHTRDLVLSVTMQIMSECNPLVNELYRGGQLHKVGSDWRIEISRFVILGCLLSQVLALCLLAVSV